MTELSVSSTLKINLCLVLILSSAINSSWRPMTSSIAQGQCWSQDSNILIANLDDKEDALSESLQKHETGRKCSCEGHLGSSS